MKTSKFLIVAILLQYNCLYAQVSKMDNIAVKNEGKFMEQLFKKKFGDNNPFALQIGDLYTKRKAEIDKINISSKTDDIVLFDRLYLVYTLYDSLIDKCRKSAQLFSFINQKLSLLSDIKPIAQKQKDSLTSYFMFLNSSDKNLSLLESLKISMTKVLSDTIYYAAFFNDQISKTALIYAKYNAGIMETELKLSKYAVAQVLPILFQKERKLSLILTSFESDTKERRNLLTQNKLYYDSIIEVNLIRQGFPNFVSQFSIAVKEKDKIGLTNTQIDSLISKAFIVERMREGYLAADPLGKFDSKEYETENMLKIVSEDQYQKILIIKNRSQAKAESEVDLKEMIQRNLVAANDRDSISKQLYNYYLAKWTIYYRYGNDKTKQTAGVKDIQDHMPACLRALTNARKYNNPINTTKGGFQ